VAVRIRLKKMGRRHRPFFRICAMDQRAPRDGRVLEELGTYDPMVPQTDARAVLNGERIAHWISVGAQPTEKVAVLIKKYGLEGTHLEKQRAAMQELARGRRRPDILEAAPAKPTRRDKKKEAAAEAAAVEAEIAAEELAETPTEVETPAEETAAETPVETAESPAEEATEEKPTDE